MKQSALLPQHLAVIMDGNGRWAEQRGQRRSMGHLAGARVMRDVVAHCAAAGVAHLSLYAFSSDNWQRPAAEVNGLLTLFTSHLRSQAAALAREGIRLSVIGRRDRLPMTLVRAIATAESRTAAGRGMQLRVAIDYSSRDAIRQAHASPSIAATAPAAAMRIADTAVPALLPPVDLLLRTGGEKRLSDFLLWESAYAELSFVDVLWPDVTPAVLDAVFADYATRDRRFGALSTRVSA